MEPNYCVMGLFGINMPLLYGESHDAFHRLQKEIMDTTGDLTLLAWDSSTDNSLRDSRADFCSMFAQHPSAFRGSSRIEHPKYPFKPPDFCDHKGHCGPMINHDHGVL